MNSNLQQTITPIYDSLYPDTRLTTPRECESVLPKSAAAKASWKLAPIADLAAACKRMLDWLLERAGEIGEELTWQIGRPITYSPNEIRRGFQERVKHMAEIAER